jgi:hypothetical protein
MKEMFNELYLNAQTAEACSLITRAVPLEDIFPEEIFSGIQKFKSGEIDNLIIHGLSVPESISETPQQIRKAVTNTYPAYIIESIGNFLGSISEKNIENTIRFRSEDGTVNEETWHGHYQYKCSVFYCLRADPEAKTYFFSANTLIETAPKEISDLLLRPLKYIENAEPFSLISKNESGYEISHHIYGRSDIEKYIKDLDLPDVIKALENLINTVTDQEAKNAVEYLLNTLKKCDVFISYLPGDVALYNEECTMRFSPAYIPSTRTEEDRWILALSVKK